MMRAVIFDMDGVIAETEQAHIEAEKQTLMKYGVLIAEDELHTFTGATAKYMFSELIRKYKLPTTVDKIFGEKEHILFRLLDQKVEPTRGVGQLIEKLKKMDIQLAVASSAHRRLVNYVLDKLQLKHCFRAVVCAEDVSNGKPDPELFLLAAKRLGIKPVDCLVVEDAELGVKAAKKAGMKCLGYVNPHSGRQNFSEADAVTDDFSSLDVQKLFSLFKR